MMNVLIIEDETSSFENIKTILTCLNEDINIVGWLQSVEKSLLWFNENSSPDLIFMDIQLSDDVSFKIFETINITTPIIFTTAFNEYAIKAFDVNSIDYLLKPLDTEKVKKAITKYKQRKTINSNQYQNLLSDLKSIKNDGNFKARFLIHSADELIVVNLTEVAYFYRDKHTYLVLKTGQKYTVNYSLEKLEEVIDPQKYFRLNRQIFSSLDSISKIALWYNAKLKITLKPNLEIDTFVSREKANSFKTWIEK